MGDVVIAGGDVGAAGPVTVGGGPYDGDAAVGGTDARPGVGTPDVGGSCGFGAVNAHLQNTPKRTVARRQSASDRSRAPNGVRVSRSASLASYHLSVTQAGT
ncbi:hypothetical protein GCM10009681_24820 [Luedemannella helvata]|uniref:Uncharacterized protein n=1 Tax=Luedemannella helvata TaxID=349315 RepID=A0ABP4WJM2_9ACTN